MPQPSYVIPTSSRFLNSKAVKTGRGQYSAVNTSLEQLANITDCCNIVTGQGTSLRLVLSSRHFARRCRPECSCVLLRVRLMGPRSGVSRFPLFQKLGPSGEQWRDVGVRRERERESDE